MSTAFQADDSAGPPPLWDDDLADAIALVTAARNDNAVAVRVILRHCSLAEVAVSLAKLMAEACDEPDVTESWWRLWAAVAAERP
jgi:hypothetical protein